MNKTRYIIKTNLQGSDEWLKDRLGHFTGTDATAVANNGSGLLSLVYEKVAERLTGKSKEDYQNDAMLRGKEIEQLGINSFELELGLVVQRVGFIELNEFVGASVDGLVDDDSILELKCPNDANFVKYMYEKRIAPNYVWQIQHYLYVLDRSYAYFVVFNPNFEKSTIITRVERDAAAIEKIELGLETGIAKVKEILAKI